MDAALTLTVIAYVILTGYTSVNAIVKAEVFPASIRALGVGLGYAIANSMFGGTAPVIYQALSAAKQTTWFIIYVTAVIAMSLVVSQAQPTFHDVRALREIGSRPVLGVVSVVPSPELTSRRRRTGMLFAGAMGGLLVCYGAALAFTFLTSRAF